jgi:hypothetical protein
MPYENESASRLGHVPLAQSPVVRETLARWTMPTLEPGNPQEIMKRCFSLEHLTTDDRPDPAFAIAFDGSNQEAEARSGYPSVRVGYIQIAGVLVKIDEFLNARVSGLVDAKRLEAAHISQTVNAVLPSSGINLPGLSGVDTWRTELARAFNEQRITDFGNDYTLTDALFTIHGAPGVPAATIQIARCPKCGDESQLVARNGEFCATGCGTFLFPTDWLRTHEEFSEEGPNAMVLTRAMSVAERLYALAYIDGFYQKQPSTLANGIFITDGPLAFYGTTAKLKTQMINYWTVMCAGLATQGLAPPLIVGIEKTGRFVDHANAIKEQIPNRHVMRLDTSYINTRIVNMEADHHYGKDEFYGRRFIYKTSSGNILVVSIPRTPGGAPYEQPRSSTQGVLNLQPSEELGGYPTLRKTLETLDRLQTVLYPNAVIPVALANSAAALPLGTGRSVLTILAQQSLGLQRDSVSLSRMQTRRFR